MDCFRNQSTAAVFSVIEWPDIDWQVIIDEWLVCVCARAHHLLLGAQTDDASVYVVSLSRYSMRRISIHVFSNTYHVHGSVMTPSTAVSVWTSLK